MRAPQQPHFEASLSVLHYLKGSPGKGILMASSSPLQLIAYAECDWVSCPDTRRSTSDLCTFLGSIPIS